MSSLIASFGSNDEKRNLHKILNKESWYYLELYFLHEKNRLQKKDFFLRSIDMLFKILTLEKKYEKHCSDYVAIKVYFSLFLVRV